MRNPTLNTWNFPCINTDLSFGLKSPTLYQNHWTSDFIESSPCRFSQTETSIAELACAWKLRRGVPSPRNGSQWLSLPIPWSGWSGCRLQGKNRKETGHRTWDRTAMTLRAIKTTQDCEKTPPLLNDFWRPTATRNRPEPVPSGKTPACSWHPTPPGGHYCSSFWSKNFWKLVILQMCCDNGGIFIL